MSMKSLSPDSSTSHLATFWNWRVKDSYPHTPIGRTRMTWRFRLSEIEAYLNAQPQRAAAKMPVAVPRTKERNRLG